MKMLLWVKSPVKCSPWFILTFDYLYMILSGWIQGLCTTIVAPATVTAMANLLTSDMVLNVNASNEHFIDLASTFFNNQNSGYFNPTFQHMVLVIDPRSY